MARFAPVRALVVAGFAVLVLGGVLVGSARLVALAQGAAPAAQDVATDDDAITFRHLTRDDGVPSDAVADVTQDALGFIWIATNEGLARFDGVDMVGYRRKADSTSISGNVVQVVEPGAGGVVWAGTRTGLSRYDPARDAFLRVHGLPSDDVLAIEADSLGGAWVGTTAGLAHVTASGEVDVVDQPSASDMGSLPSASVEDVLLASDGTLWVGTDDGLARRAPGSDRFDTFRPNSDSVTVLNAFRIQALAPTQRGAILVATFGSGLLAFDPQTERFSPLPIGRDVLAQNVMDAHEDGDGTIWAATLGGGLLRLTPGVETPRVYRNSADDPNSLAEDQVSALYEDRQGILWVATYSGLDRFDRARGKVLRLRHDPEIATSIASNTVRAVLKTEDALYVGTDVSLDVSEDGRTFRHLSIDTPDRDAHPVRALYRDRNGTVWVGTEGAGFRVVDGGEIQTPPQPADEGDAVTSFLEDNEGRFWFGTLTRGLGLYDRQSRETTFFRHDPRRPSSLLSDRVRALAEDAAGDLWVGTDEGLCHLNRPAGGGDFTCFGADEDDPSALSNGIVHALHASDDGALWIGTGNGFYRLDTRDPEAGFKRYDPSQYDLPGEAVYGIVEDDADYLWLTTNGGLTRFVPLTEVFSERLGTSDAERALNGAASLAPDGQLYFGSTRGLLAFYPQKLAALNANPPQVAIIRVDVAGEAVVPGDSDVLSTAAPVADRIDLDHDAAFLTIHYAGLHFSDPTENTYRFRLVGLFDDWRDAGDAGTTREATFSSLPPGRYTFEVQAANADGIGFKDEGEPGFDAATKRLVVVVHPPWWRTWWALLLFAALAVLAVIRMDRWQRARLLRQERERADRREAELRAETAEAEQRKVSAEAAALKAENDRKAAELERTREVENANAKLAAANSQLETSLRDLRATQAQLVQSEKLASLGQLTAGIAHEIKNPLNFVNNFADLSVELADDLRKDLLADPARPVGEVVDEVGDLLDDLQENARRIREHGQRADRIVRSMLLHSRGGSSERGRVDLNRFIDEYANLAFHGARANDSDFQVDVVRDFDEATGEVEIVPQEFGRVLINLLTNAFHAVSARSHAEGDAYHPTVTVRTRRQDGEVTIEIEDNGTGIPAAVKAKIFEPFFTTKPTGEGTGLGLSLAHDIVTQVHGGRMAVESAEGEGTTFEVVLPTSGPTVLSSGDGAGGPRQ